MDLSVYLPPGAKNLVEFGCGSGEMGRSFKRIAPFCRYVGVEKNAALAREARAHLDEAVTADAADVAFHDDATTEEAQAARAAAALWVST